MCVSQHQWMSYKRPYYPVLPLIFFLFPLGFLLSMSLIAQGAIHIPKHYKIHNMSQPPVLMEMPTSFTAFSQDDICLPCEASGNPPPTYRWIKDGEQFGQELTGSGTLKAQDKESLESYAGSYRCYASNTLGTAMTQTIQVIVEPQPILQKHQKLHKEAYEGSGIILTCNPPKSSIPPNIHWMDKNMVHIEQNSRVMTGLDGNLYFSNLLKSDSRDDYICNAQYTKAMTILPETAIKLTVMPSNDVHGRKPHLFRPFGSHTSIQALRGHIITLECIPKGLPTPQVEWTKKDGRLDETSGKIENHNRWLKFSSITQADDGEYQCKASNSYGAITHAFTVTVEASPYWLKEPQNLMYAPGETVRLDCVADGIPTPTITWSINGQTLSEVDPDPRRSLTGSTLILRDVEYEDTAVYQCEATNKHGSILLNTYLFVVELPPQILSSDGVVYRVIEGGDIKLHCESFGSPRPQITWEDEFGSPLLSDPRASLLTNGTIELLKVSQKDSGGYTCSVKDFNISITANLVVFNKTVILPGPRNISILRGSTAFLDCDCYRDPRLHISSVIWKKDGYILQESSPDDKYTIFENSTLKVTNVQSEDTAHYSCEVNTELDQADATTSFTVVAPPDPPTALSLFNIKDNSYTLSWLPGSSQNSNITAFIVEAQEEAYSEKGKQSWVEWKKVPGDFNHIQLILRPFCTYRFRVTAVNAIGQSRASEPSEDYSTPPAAPDINPSGVRSNSTQPGSLVITWDEMEKRLHNSQDFHYKVFWREFKGTNMPWKSTSVKFPPHLVNNTGIYTPFEIKVQSVNAVGKGPEPNTTIGHSGEDEPEEAPKVISSVVMNTTVNVTWNQAQKVRGFLLGYKIYFRRLSLQSGQALSSFHKKHHVEKQGRHGDMDNWVVEVKGTITSKEVGGLHLFSKYVLQITAFNSKGESPRSPPHPFDTPEGAPGPPASLRLESPTETSLILYWTPPLETNGILLGYVVQYQQVVESEDSLVKMQMISDPNVNHISLEDLDPKSYYIFKVIARTAAGDGPPITRRGATLIEGVPPKNITIVSSNTSFNLSWVPGERHRNHGFHIEYLRISGGGWQKSEVINSTQGSYSLMGLQPGMLYHLKISDGNHTQWEDTVWTMGPVPSEMPSGFSTQGWLIGLISAVVLLVLILLILCLIKHKKGGKYAVKDREEKQVDSEARPMKDETFGEYRSLDSDLDEKHSDSQPSLFEDSKLGSDDSLAEYGDSVDIQFNEDGSFIGQYSGRGPVPRGNESSNPASPVNAVPHPPIVPPMSSILSRTS